MRIPEKITAQTNNFDFMRLIAALFVIFGHSLLVTQTSLYFIKDYGVSIATTGLNIFFIISGFLITKSWLDAPNFLSFFKKRFLRIYPALAATILLSIFILGPMVTFFGSSDYFFRYHALDYLKNMLLLPLLSPLSHGLPGVFMNNPVPLIVNGSLWTIPIEVLFYIIISLIGVVALLKRRGWVLFIFIIFLVFSISLSTNSALMAYVAFPFSVIFQLGTYFFAGAVIYLYRKSFHMPNAVLGLFLLMYISSIGSAYFKVLDYVCLPVIIISLAFLKINFPKKITIWGDFSYGLYLVAFPVQQSLQHFHGGKMPFLLHFLLSMAISLPLAILSWHYIEKPSLALKSKAL